MVFNFSYRCCEYAVLTEVVTSVVSASVVWDDARRLKSNVITKLTVQLLLLLLLLMMMMMMVMIIALMT